MESDGSIRDSGIIKIYYRKNKIDSIAGSIFYKL